jgi:hypothetical protein
MQSPIKNTKFDDAGGLPLIFVQKSYFWQGYTADYHLAPVRMGALTNPRSPVFFVSDRYEPLFEDLGVIQLDLSELSERAQVFAKSYVHFSSGGVEGERFCMERWFVILELLDRFQLKQCLALDTDFMLLEDLSAERERFEGFDLSLSKGVSPNCNFISSKSLLAEFCELLEATYVRRVPELIQEIARTVIGGLLDQPLQNISDMNFWRMLVEREKLRNLDLSQPCEGVAYDHNLALSEGHYELVSELHPLILRGAPDLKNLRFESGRVTCFSHREEREIQLRGLHFQGFSKLWIDLVSRIIAESPKLAHQVVLAQYCNEIRRRE